MSVKVLVISISNPILVGVYKDDLLIEEFESDEKTTEILPVIMQKIDKNYTITKVAYVNSPGSFMAIKVAYIFLKSFCLIKEIQLAATNGFNFNQNSPIKALGKRYFKNKNSSIEIEDLKECEKLEKFTLPKSFDENIFDSNSLPNYCINAV